MIVELKPEHQKILEQEILSGRTQEEVLDQAFAIIQAQHDMDDWLIENREEIAAQIEEGYAQAERGELLDPDQVRQMLQERRQNRKTA
jgi:predicted transcriptional regulator